MSDYPELTQETLATLRDEFSKKVEELDELPAKVNEAFDRLKWVSITTYYSWTVVRDDIQSDLSRIISEIKKAVEGMFAPWLFVDYAYKWQQVGTKVSHAYGMQNSEELNLEGNWDGSAYKSYKESKNFQANAMLAIKGLCDGVHEQLLIIAEEGRILYKGIIDKLATIISEVAVFAAQSASTGGAAVPFVIGDLNAAIVAGAELIVEAITNFAETQTKVWTASNELKAMVDHPGAFANASGTDAWPSPNTKEYDNKDDDWHLNGEDK
ncbi:hypothetical protein IU438_13440 [Nocardia cyriacigeorgica]|uniref:hypothetical protein n=1 Tax=Nocardia cyriacigeorgica TaxID=135487 RepID=UPI00189529ED|nr:hypothetical protein [Nocardia cyriacigeorgica]MBF6396797.1 hypothetical protein [Nocardia cyriacigeorgica]MBF6403545.1 hypothetical protein [Nocardia cyriacigeorgica]